MTTKTKKKKRAGRKKLRSQIKRMLDVMRIGRPADPRDGEIWDETVLSAERCLKREPDPIRRAEPLFVLVDVNATRESDELVFRCDDNQRTRDLRTAPRYSIPPTADPERTNQLAFELNAAGEIPGSELVVKTAESGFWNKLAAYDATIDAEANNRSDFENMWSLYGCAQSTGRDFLIASGTELTMRKKFGAQIHANEDVWLIDPNGNKHLPNGKRIDKPAV